MGNVKIDLTNYKPQFGDRVDPGRYLAKVTSVDQTVAKSSGNPMLVVWLEIAVGPFEGKALRTNLTLTEKAMFKVVEFLSAMGHKTPKKALTINTDQWLNKPVIVDVEERENEYNGSITTRTEIAAVLRATPDLVKTMRGSTNLSDATEPAADVDDVDGDDEVVEAEVVEAEEKPKAAKAQTKKAEPEPAEEDEADEADALDDDEGDVDIDAMIGNI